MTIYILYQILAHPFLLPPAPKCMVKHQFFKDQSTNWFLNLSTVYIPILYGSQAPRPLKGYITAILAYLTHYSVYIWCPTGSMFIAMLYPNLIYPLLLPSVLKCVVMHQLFMDIPEIYFLKFSMIYPFNLYNNQGPRLLTGIYSCGIPKYIACIYSLCMFSMIKFIHMNSYTLYLFKLQGLQARVYGGNAR